MSKLIKVILLLFINFLLIKCGEKQPSNNKDTCQQQAGDVIAQSNTACQVKDVNKTGACGTAEPSLTKLVKEPCNSTVSSKRRRTIFYNMVTIPCVKRCEWSYFSKTTNQTVCVGQRIVTGLQQGDIQFELGLQLLKPCSVNGEQRCAGLYGYVTCNNGTWSVSEICDPEFSCVTSEEVILRILKLTPTSSTLENVTIKKAKCVLTNSTSISTASSVSTTPLTTVSIRPSTTLPPITVSLSPLSTSAQPISTSTQLSKPISTISTQSSISSSVSLSTAGPSSTSSRIIATISSSSLTSSRLTNASTLSSTLATTSSTISTKPTLTSSSPSSTNFISTSTQSTSTKSLSTISATTKSTSIQLPSFPESFTKPLSLFLSTQNSHSIFTSDFINLFDFTTASTQPSRETTTSIITTKSIFDFLKG